ncbi:hypothetical protein SynMITS9220_01844 [Synechococcus sp. MIT S9220]|nr:hypothetical protein SynMITS9220_01844 [Synechococcus sp. MIT S9220]
MLVHHTDVRLLKAETNSKWLDLNDQLVILCSNSRQTSIWG